MVVHFLIGRSGSGKTTNILQQISAELSRSSQGNPMVLVVPEQGSYQAENALVTSGSVRGIARAQVLSFQRLAFRVMQETGGSARVGISEEGKRMLLYKIIQRRKEELKLFGPSGDQVGFVGRLGQLYTEMKRYCIDASNVSEQLALMNSNGLGTPILRDKLGDIVTLYRDFEHELSPLYMDNEDYLMTLAEAIPNSPYVKDADIWIDSFHGFTPQEYTVLQQLMLHASSVTIALTLDKTYEMGILPHELDLFHPSATTYAKLKGMAGELGIETSDRLLSPNNLPKFVNSPELAHLERGYDRRIPWREDQQTEQLESHGISIHAAVNRRAEVEGALREMLRLVRKEGVRYREMAIFVRQIGDYEPILGPLCRDYDVPFFLDQKRSELHHPLVEFIRSALDIVKRRWKYEDVFRCIKTDLLLPLDGSVNRKDMDKLENYVLACGIHGYRWTDGQPWRATPSLSLEGDANIDREQQGEELLALMERCRATISSPLLSFENRVKTAKSAQDLCTAVYLLLEEAQVPHKLDLLSHEALEAGQPEAAKEHRQLWGAVLDLLDQIVELMGEEHISFDLFMGILDTGLTELKLSLVPPSIDQILIGNMDRTRTNGVKYAFLLGFNDGVVPAILQEDGVLTEQERLLLSDTGMELAPSISRKLLDERFLIYNALTSASQHVWISYASADEEGKALLPSEVIRHVKKMFPFLKEQSLVGQAQRGQTREEQLDFVTNPKLTLSQLIIQLRNWKNGSEISDLWWEAYNWYLQHEQWREPMLMLLRSLFYVNEGAPLARKTSRRLYGSRIRTSVSRMEKFVACPFSHFASHGLKLKERQMYRLKAPDIGQLFHSALSDIATQLQSRRVSWGSLTLEECRSEANIAVDRLTPLLQGEILLSSKRYAYISRKLKNIVGRASMILGEHARRGNFEPVGLELDFGTGKTLPALNFPLENGSMMEVVGRIDRVDMAQGEQGIMLRVIDYKSSRNDLKLHEVYYGLSLQLLTYLDVLLTYSEEWLGRTAIPAGTLYFHVHDPLLQSTNGMSAEQAADELLKRFKMKGLLLADRDVIAQMDTSLDKGYSTILPVALKSDGSFYSSAAVASKEQWGSLLATVRSNITNIGTRITEGEVKVEPYRIQNEIACTFCPYKSVCHFDESIEGSHYRVLGKPNKEQIWDMLTDKQGGDTL
ncbi:helicase-exonuclease AddAB subunit AddB [Paenibacillus crassostreae]|uniref:ATP-dependent helicase/deoxyribonuclease subunit B n=1 Tax=Paenibacillus crassostreae TaxID=1763538 RepID=A0A162KRE1_9BACL|nr:helicase-exonuclease AddAB subunit AddB [Paenibacillus crassostreae]AOZ91734.1 helicase-exonuclease AddAB subunit AddB [Paenibacillus crassostreae]OAB72693.1 helicase-exonuclease AddAB subunit AddB [Paenibacillus crassostreae]